MKRFLTSILTVLCAIGALVQNVGRPRSTPSNNTEDYITKKSVGLSQANALLTT